MTTPNPNTTPRYTNADIAAAVAQGLSNAADRPIPGLDPDRSPQEYATRSQYSLRRARQYLESGDQPQASLAAWEMVAETVPAITARQGGVIYTHQSIVAVVWELAQMAGDAGDAEAARLVRQNILPAYNMLHNFNANHLNYHFVHFGLELCAELSQRLYTLFWPDGAPDPA